MTKIDIISGFLGAGKTTFIKKMLEEVFSGEKVVLVENEYGEVGIDGGFLKDSGIEIKELNSGCICCSLVGDFSRSLNEVIETYHPDRILIEPSGVGKLSDVMSSVKKMEEDHDVKLNALVTVANAMKASKQMKAFGEFFNNQIQNATTIVLSRTQNTPEAKLELCVREIQALNPKAAIITTPWDEISGEQILRVVEQQKSLMEEMMAEYEEHHHDHDHDHDHEHHHDHDGGRDHDHHDHHADEVFTSWGKETPHKFTRERIEEILKIFCETEDYGTILRSKGMVPAEDGTWIYFDMVPGEYELREGEPDYTGRLCVIGTDIEEHKLEELFGLV
ncbi:MAG: CobW family GTP-binding protein [Eubacterium sp.]